MIEPLRAELDWPRAIQERERHGAGPLWLLDIQGHCLSKPRGGVALYDADIVIGDPSAAIQRDSIIALWLRLPHNGQPEDLLVVKWLLSDPPRVGATEPITILETFPRPIETKVPPSVIRGIMPVVAVAARASAVGAALD